MPRTICIFDGWMLGRSMKYLFISERLEVLSTTGLLFELAQTVSAIHPLQSGMPVPHPVPRHHCPLVDVAGWLCWPADNRGAACARCGPVANLCNRGALPCE